MAKTLKRKNKGMLGLAVFLWFFYLILLAFIVYLSFSDGESAKNFGKKTIRYMAEYHYETDDIPEEVMFTFTYKVRQLGRIALFIALGMLGTMTIHVTFHFWPWLLRAIISVSMLIFVAVFTERFKMYLPTRHFSDKEMVYSILGALAGFGFVSIVTFVFSFVRWVLRGIYSFITSR